MIFISIHAPRVGGDITDVSLCRRPDNFNPRPPCGGATLSREAAEKALGISIHAPRVGGDGYTWAGLASAVISIHAPRVGGDPSG